MNIFFFSYDHFSQKCTHVDWAWKKGGKIPCFTRTERKIPSTWKSLKKLVSALNPPRPPNKSQKIHPSVIDILSLGHSDFPVFLFHCKFSALLFRIWKVLLLHFFLLSFRIILWRNYICNKARPTYLLLDLWVLLFPATEINAPKCNKRNEM